MKRALTLLASAFFLMCITPSFAKDPCDKSCNVSSARWHPAPHRSAMAYYLPYPWWWNEPTVPRVRTNYVKWHDTYYERPYDAPHPSGVIGVTIFGPWYW